MKRFITLTFSFIMALLVGCTENTNINDKITVATSIPPVAQFIEKVCEDKVNIITLLPNGASPETYEPSLKDKQLLENARLYFSVGVPMEETSIIPSLRDNILNIKLYETVNKQYTDLYDGEHRDPHIWLSVKRAKIMVNTIAEEMADIDTSNAEFYKKNATEYISALDSLQAEIKNIFKTKENRKFIVFHPAFNYFAEDFDLQSYALEEHGKETTAKNLGTMIDFAKKENIKTVFYQAEASAKMPETFANEISGKAVKLYPLAYDYIQNLKSMANELAKAMK